MRPLPSIALAALIGSAAPARAEDFTGFYAGVNAGFAHGRGSERFAPDPGSAAPASENALPPSALSAAGRLDAQRSAARRTGPR